MKLHVVLEEALHLVELANLRQHLDAGVRHPKLRSCGTGQGLRRQPHRVADNVNRRQGRQIRMHNEIHLSPGFFY